MNASAFPPSSRYSGLDTVTLETPHGRTILYVRRRFVPQPERFATFGQHTVTEGERLDNIAAQYLGDPEQYWRLCDANAAMRPEDLTDTPGGTIRIALPEGVAGSGGNS
jgi:hypothetical protein